MSDFASKFGQGLDRMQHQGGTVPRRPAQVVADQPQKESSWHSLAEALGITPEAGASQEIPQQHVPPAPAGYIDPYQNLNNRIQGKPYR